MKNENVEKKNEKSRTETGTGTQCRVVITKEANQELENLVEKIKEGNETVEITKSDVANYVFGNLNKFLSEADIKALKNIYFDERKVLQNLLKQSQEGAELPLEIKRMVRDLYGLGEQSKRRNSKNSSEAVLES
jgi:3-oxoacyl-[acyl-carrier-protein] synthase III